MFVTDSAAFTPAAIPDWVTEWQGRRRKTAAPKAGSDDIRHLTFAEAAPPPPPDLEAEAKKAAAAVKRAGETRRSVRAATEELESWLGDQLAGLPGFLAELPARCRRIAARLVDGKAAALASRIDEMPSRLLALTPPERIDAAIAELGKLVLLVRAWRAAPDEPELRREVIGAETRDDVLGNPQSPRLTGLWEVLGERVTTRRDGLVSVATWLLQVAEPARFAVLLDFFPASAGRRLGAFAAGERFAAELVFYPAAAPLRAVIATREPSAAAASWAPALPDPAAQVAAHLLAAPWALEVPLLLPPGRIGIDAQSRHWWQSADIALPLDSQAPPVALGVELAASSGLWNGARLGLIAAQSSWGRLAFHG
jgi:hypothetical protein